MLTAHRNKHIINVSSVIGSNYYFRESEGVTETFLLLLLNKKGFFTFSVFKVNKYSKLLSSDASSKLPYAVPTELG
jgi:hypothetical protein